MDTDMMNIKMLALTVKPAMKQLNASQPMVILLYIYKRMTMMRRMKRFPAV